MNTCPLVGKKRSLRDLYGKITYPAQVVRKL